MFLSVLCVIFAKTAVHLVNLNNNNRFENPSTTLVSRILTCDTQERYQPLYMGQGLAKSTQSVVRNSKPLMCLTRSPSTTCMWIHKTKTYTALASPFFFLESVAADAPSADSVDSARCLALTWREQMCLAHCPYSASGPCAYRSHV